MNYFKSLKKMLASDQHYALILPSVQKCLQNSGHFNHLFKEEEIRTNILFQTHYCDPRLLVDR